MCFFKPHFNYLSYSVPLYQNPSILYHLVRNDGAQGSIVAFDPVLILINQVKANNIQGEAEWSFGQILAVVLLFSSANEILHFFLGLCKGEEAGDTVIAIRPSFARFSSDSCKFETRGEVARLLIFSIAGSTRRRVPRGTIKNGSVSETGASSERVPLTYVLSGLFQSGYLTHYAHRNV